MCSQEAEWLEGFLRGHDLIPDLSLTPMCGRGPLLPPPQLTGEKLQGNSGNGSCVVLPLLLQALPSFQLFLLCCFGNWLQLILPEQLSTHENETALGFTRDVGNAGSHYTAQLSVLSSESRGRRRSHISPTKPMQ